MIDYIILTAYSPFAVIMQLHPGWVRSALKVTHLSGPAYCCNAVGSRDNREPRSCSFMLVFCALDAEPRFLGCMQVGFLQTQVLGCLGCLWFNRNEVRCALVL